MLVRTGIARTLQDAGSDIRTALRLVAEQVQDDCDPRIDRMWCVHLAEFPFAHEGIRNQTPFLPKAAGKCLVQRGKYFYRFW
jgi:hypothetical protein